jgi:hypothetical protein
MVSKMYIYIFVIGESTVKSICESAGGKRKERQSSCVCVLQLRTALQKNTAIGSNNPNAQKAKIVRFSMADSIYKRNTGADNRIGIPHSDKTILSLEKLKSLHLVSGYPPLRI